jgi:hypothetical protein
MSLWPPTSWTRRDAPDLCEYAFAGAGVILIACASLADPVWKAILGASAGFTGIATLISKFVSKRRDDEEKKAKEQAERQEREARETRVRSLTARIVRPVLDEMRQRYFAKETDTEKHKHRLTLFVCVESDATTGRAKHLAIFARSGVHLDSPRTWALDDNNPDGCRGVAGKIWFHGVTDMKIAVCDWPLDGNREDKERYAASLDITVAEAETLNVKSRAFAGAPIFVGRRKWGVLLLDSLKEGFITDTPQKKGLLNRYTNLLECILTEAEA